MALVAIAPCLLERLAALALNLERAQIFGGSRRQRRREHERGEQRLT
jgi:hypothetical protein